MHDTRLCRIVNHKVGFEVLQLLLCRTDEHIRDEMCLPRHLDNKANRHARILVGATERIDNEKALVAEFADGNFTNRVPRFL